MQWFGELNWVLIVSVAGIVIAILVPWIQRRSKRLSCSYSTSLLAVTHHYREQLEVHYLGQRVHAASVVDLTLRNTGNQSIRKLDFESPIRLGFGRAAHLLTYEVIATVPSALRPELQPASSEGRNVRASAVEVGPLLLNPGDLMSLRFVVDDAANVTIDARIVGVKSVEINMDDVWNKRVEPFGSLMWFFIACMIGASVQGIVDGLPRGVGWPTLASSLAAVAMATAITAARFVGWRRQVNKANRPSMKTDV